MELGTIALIGAVILGLALAWGLYQNSRRDRRQDARTDAVTRDLYERGGDDTEEPRKT
jgi:hypothetical protein